MVSERLKEAINEFRKAAENLYLNGVHPFRFGRTLRNLGLSGSIKNETLEAIRNYRLARARLIRAILEETL